jgi:hypothetical protein
MSSMKTGYASLKPQEKHRLLVLVAGEGRAAEWKPAGWQQSNFAMLIALICASATVVAGFGISDCHQHQRVLPMSRINSAIAGGTVDIDIPAGDGVTESGRT